MQSDGGLTSVNEFSGHKAILSGPAGAWRLHVWPETSCTVEHAQVFCSAAYVPRGSPWLRPHHLPRVWRPTHRRLRHGGHQYGWVARSITDGCHQFVHTLMHYISSQSSCVPYCRSALPRRVSVRWGPGARVRDDHCRRADPGAPAGHQHCGCWRGIPAGLPRR